MCVIAINYRENDLSTLKYIFIDIVIASLGIYRAINVSHVIIGRISPMIAEKVIVIYLQVIVIYFPVFGNDPRIVVMTVTEN